MAFLKKTPTYRNLTQADYDRLARVDSDPRKDWQKLKWLIVLSKDGLNQEVYINVYGKDKDDLKAHIQEHLENFKKDDKSWKILRMEDLKKRDDDQLEE